MTFNYRADQLRDPQIVKPHTVYTTPDGEQVLVCRNSNPGETKVRVNEQVLHRFHRNGGKWVVLRNSFNRETFAWWMTPEEIYKEPDFQPSEKALGPFWAVEPIGDRRITQPEPQVRFPAVGQHVADISTIEGIESHNPQLNTLRDFTRSFDVTITIQGGKVYVQQ